MAEYIRKIVMLGDPGVGKTSLVRKFVHDMFDDKYLSTLGAKPTKRLIKVNDDNLTMMIWDFLSTLLPVLSTRLQYLVSIVLQVLV